MKGLIATTDVALCSPRFDGFRAMYLVNGFAMVPRDPLYAEQWHFGLIGNIEAIWRDYDGTGVVIGLNDDRPELLHPDLDGNIDSALGLSFDDFGSDVDAHGTAVAGIIAAEANDQGGVGVAPGARLGWLSYYYEGYDASLARTVDFDIVNNSWGFFPGFATSDDLSDPNSVASGIDSLLRFASETGRSGLGSISVHAAGNDNFNAIGEWFSGTRFTISVAATESDGFAAYYSSYGSSVLLTAPSAAVTTDGGGAGGYGPEDYIFDFGGTSGSAPVVTGVVALMLEAAPGLGWRDVKTILALSAAQTGSAPDATAPAETEDGLWQVLGNGNWNGGGQLYHVNYGYGMVDAFAAVRMAEAWLTMTGGAATSANETVISTAAPLDSPLPIAPPMQAVPQVTRIAIEVTEDVLIETVYLSLRWMHQQTYDLAARLIAPDGYAVMLSENEGFAPAEPGIAVSWTFGIEALRNLSARGTWTLEIMDHVPRNTGVVEAVSLTFHGREASRDTIHTITDDFLFLAPLESGRRMVADSDGGTDWLNLAAIAGDIRADLRGFNWVQVDGEEWFQLGQGRTRFENAYAGDGDDRLTGHAGNNHLIGARGNDRLLALNGADTLDGGAGRDFLRGGAGNDLLLGGAQGDRLFGHLGADTLVGGSGSDLLTGGAGADTFIFDSRFGSDRITDFKTGIDSLVFSSALTGGLTAAFEIVDRFMQVVDDGLLFDFGPGQQLLLAGVLAPPDPAADIRVDVWI